MAAVALVKDAVVVTAVDEVNVNVAVVNAPAVKKQSNIGL